MKKGIVGILMIGLVIQGCGKKEQTVTLEGSQKESALKTSNPLVDNILAGYNANDYGTFSRDFSEKMKNKLNKAVFAQTHAEISGKIGQYKSKKVDDVKKKGPYTIVLYKADFENEKDAARSVDLRLIHLGKEPINVLVRK